MTITTRPRWFLERGNAPGPFKVAGDNSVVGGPGRADTRDQPQARASPRMASSPTGAVRLGRRCG